MEKGRHFILMNYMNMRERERERERDCDIHNQRKVVNLKSPLEKKTDMNQIIH